MYLLLLQEPSSFSTTAQSKGTTDWHIPYDDGSPRASYQLPRTWLCTKANPHSSNMDQRTVRSVPFMEADNTLAHNKEKLEYMANNDSRQYPKLKNNIGGQKRVWQHNTRKEPLTADVLGERNVQSSKVYNYDKKNSKIIKKVIVSDLFRK